MALSSDGFASGFAQGFGLIGGVQDRQLQRDRLEEQARQSDLDRDATATFRKTQLDNEAKDRLATSEYRKNQLRIEEDYKKGLIDTTAEKNRLAKQQLDRDNDPENPDNIEKISQSNLRNEQAELTKAQTNAANKKLAREEKKQSSIEREQAFAVNANAYIEHLKTGSSAGLRDEAWRKKADELFSSALGGLTNPFKAAHPNTEADMASFQKVLENMQSGGEVDRGSVTDLLNMLLLSNNERQVGTELTEENTPSAGHLNGKGWRIESKQISPDWNIVNGQITGTVDVIVVNDRNERAGYNANLSFKRGGTQMDENGDPILDPETGKPMKASAQPISTQDLISSAAGYFKYAQYARQFKDEITESAGRLYNLQNGEGALSKAVNSRVAQYQVTYGTGEKANQESPVKGMTNAELIADTSRLQEYMTFAVLDPSQNAPKATPALDGIISVVAELDDVKKLEKTLGRKLDRQELLLASHYFSEGGVLEKESRKSWNNFRIGLLRQEGSFEKPRGYTGTGGVPVMNRDVSN